MKKVFLLCSIVAIAMMSVGACSTKVSNKCECTLCQLCDSLAWAGQFDSLDTVEFQGDVFTISVHGPIFDKWYDSLTVYIVEDLDTCYKSMTPGEYTNYIFEAYYSHEAFREAIMDGFDGLCTWHYDRCPEAIDKFYDTYSVIDDLYQY